MVRSKAPHPARSGRIPGSALLRSLLLAAALLCAGPAAGAVPANHDALSLAAPERTVDQRAIPAGERVLHTEPRLGLPTFVWAAFAGPTRTAPPAAWEEAAFQHLHRHLRLYRLRDEVLPQLRVDAVHDNGRGAVVVSLRREIDGIPVFRDTLKVVLDRQGELVALSGYLPGVDPASRHFSLDPAEALAAAAADLGAVLPPGAYVPRGEDAAGFALFEAEGLERPARIRPVWFHLPDALLPAWHLELELEGAHLAWVVDASSGAILYRRNLVQDVRYRVWADPAAGGLPWDGPQGSAGTPHPSGTPDGWQAPVIDPEILDLEAGPISTGDPWLPPEAVETVGNNVDAYVDVSGTDGLSLTDYRAVVSAPGIFGHAYDLGANPDVSRAQRMASVTHLFYVTNWLHDWFYDAGFDEAAGNAQRDNYGRGGAGDDPLLAEAQDYSGRNNANMGTPADGSSPRLQMYVFDANFSRSLSIVAPESASNAFAVGLAGFGPQAFDVSGELVVGDDGVGTATDACEPLVGDYTGKVVLVDRGTCTFVSKALNAQAMGAVGIVIVNNEDGSAPGMSGDDEGVEIGVVSVSRHDGTALRGQPGVTVRLYREQAIDRDSALDTSVVAHEFAHMVTNRLVGNASGLGNNQGGSMGEGWSDFVSLLLLARPEDAADPANLDFAGAYAIGGWVRSGGGNQGYYYGMRRYPYSVSFARNPLTFRHVANDEELPPTAPYAYGRSGRINAETHRSGEVWATMLWECYVALLRRDDAPPFAETRQEMLELLVSSLAITPNDPTFVEARDALLAAAWARDPAIYRVFLEAFARRGLGVHAVAPDRWSLDHKGAVESFDAGYDLRLASATLVDDDSCDADGILDAGETGTLRLRLHNAGIGPLSETTVQISTSTPGVTIGAGTAIAVPATQPLETVEVAVPVALAGVSEATLLEVEIRIADPALGERTFTWGTWMHFDERPARSTSDDVETLRTAWTTDADAQWATHVSWNRVFVPGAGSRWAGPTPGAIADLWLVSPPLEVSRTAPLRLSFRHRHRFENRDGQAADGGVIEITADGGRTWVPVEANYLAQIPVTNPSPLRGRTVFGGQNAGWPGLDPVMIDLGTAWAGETVRIRFRVASDVAIGDAGWEIDDIALQGIDNTPFPAAEPEDGDCGNGAPVAVIAMPSWIPGGTEVVLDGSASHDPDWDELAFAWTQVDGPEVEWLDASSARARIRTPMVEDEVPVTFRLTVSDGQLSHATEKTLVLRKVNLPPVASAPETVRAKTGAQVVIDASGSVDPEGAPLNFLWQQLSGPAVTLAGRRDAVLRFQAPDTPTTLRFRLTVDDGELAADPVEVEVQVVENGAPVVTTEAALAVDERARLALVAAATDPDGDPLTFRWYQVEGEPAILENAESAEATLVAPDVDGDRTLTFAVVASDGVLESEPAQVEVLVREVNRLPIASLVPQLHVRTGAAVVLDASASEDPDGEPLTFAWLQVDGPRVALEGADAARLRFRAPDEPAVLAFEVEVADPRGGVAFADVLVHVSRSGEPGGCGCSSTGPGGMAQLGGLALVLLALRRRRARA